MPKHGKNLSVESPDVWERFLSELDASLKEPVVLHCLGGFVVKFAYGLPRPTSDIDFLAVIPSTEFNTVLQIAGQGSALHQKYGLYLRHVGVVTPPEDYDSRLRELFPGRFKNLRLMVLDPYDLVLCKIERNTPIDRDDVKYLVTTVPLDPTVLRERHETELRPYLGNPNREDLTLKLWLEAYFPGQLSAKS